MTESQDAENWQALQRLIRWAKTSPLVMVLFGASLGGGGQTYLSHRNPDPRIDSIMVDLRDIKPRVSQIQPLQDTVRGLVVRVTRIEDKDARVAYLGPRKKSLGRAWER